MFNCMIVRIYVERLSATICVTLLSEDQDGPITCRV